MQEQGLRDEQINQELTDQGFSPLEINDALEQAQIKSAVSEVEGTSPYEEVQEPEMPEQSLEQEPETQNQEYMYPSQQPYYQGYAPEQQTSNQETTTEIAEQIAEEKISKLKREFGNIEELKSVFERKIKNVDERLKKIEDIISRLQETILGKVGFYGDNIEDIKKEMSMMQESFSKALPSFAHERREREKSQ